MIGGQWGRGGVEEGRASQHLGKIPGGGEGEAVPRSAGLSWPALL